MIRTDVRRLLEKIRHLSGINPLLAFHALPQEAFALGIKLATEKAH